MGACRWCGTSNSDAAAECQACGRPIEAAGVGAELAPPPSSYTPAHVAERILASRDALVGERKQVTVLFCDVVDSTRLAAELGPEEMHSLLAELFELALEQVHRYEGTVNQFLGDGFMAIFGAPIAHQDHAALAGLAALGVRNAVARRDRVAGSGWEHIQLRMGLNSGPVVVGAIGSDLRMDYTAIGDTTNVAARLESAAEPGEILISESTARAAEGVLETVELEPLEVKGKDHPIARSRLVSAVEITTRPPRRRAEFVGRSAEIDALRATFGRVRDGAGAIVGVEGEPGVGKSRLLLEFIQGLGQDALVARGQCITYGNQIPNVPIVGLVRELCDVRAGDEASVALAKIEQSVGDDRSDAPFLAAVGGIPQALDLVREIDPATLRGRTAQSLRRLLGRRSKDRPLVAAVEDLHWADASSLEFLTEMAASVPERRVMLLATYRPGSSPTWESGAVGERVVLQPLDDAESESIVRQLPEAELLTDEQLERVLETGEGNPFFLEELARAVVQGGGDDVPGDVLDVLAARIDRLPERMKGVLRTASVIGREFEADVLRDAAEADGDLEAQLIHLSDLGFIERVVAPEERWAFVHALTQDVAYGAMLKAVRQELHLAVADVLVARFTADPRQACEEIARHLVLSTDPDRAIPYLELANDKARTTHAMEEATGFFEQAMGLLERREPTLENIEHRVRLLVGEWTVFHFLHRHAEYAELIERYLPIVEAAGAPSIRGPYLAQRGHRLWVFTRYAEARPVLEESVAICDGIGDGANAAHAAHMLLWLHALTGEYEIADGYGRSALERLESLDVPILRAFVPVAIALSHVFRGRWDEAAGWCDRAHEAGVETGDDGMASFGSSWGALAELVRGDVKASLRLAQRSIAEAPTVYFRGWGQAFMAAAMCRTADVRQGIEMLAEVAEFIRRSRHDTGYLQVGILLAEGWLYAGDPTRAREVAEEIGAWASSAGAPFHHAGMETIQAEVALAEGRHREAADGFARAAERFGVIGAENGQAQALSGLGRSLVAAGDPDSARPVLERSLATFERLGTLGEPDRVRASLAAL